MAKNKTDLIYQVLRNLGALPMGHDPNDEEFEQVNFILDPSIATLRETDVYFLADLDVIPDEAFLPLSHVVAWDCAPMFGQQADDRLFAVSERARAILQTVQSEGPYFTNLEIQAY